MNRTRISTGRSAAAAMFAGAFLLMPALPAQRVPPKPFPLTLTVVDGTNASYRVREQLVGIKFPSDAVGTSTAVTGTIVFDKNGAIDAGRSKLTFDLRTLKSDQPMRDGFIQHRTLDTEQFPSAVFVPKTITGMPNPLTGQFGFELSGDMTIHGTTAPLTWQGIATVDDRGGLVAGRLTTAFPFEKFGLTPPKIFRVMSVADSIALEVEFRTKIS
ncbi:MAG: YceI family protein [Gemmatimonadota bacterium]|nr:YceI family protein [Gemmatimonadota bacterium]